MNPAILRLVALLASTILFSCSCGRKATMTKSDGSTEKVNVVVADSSDPIESEYKEKAKHTAGRTFLIKEIRNESGGRTLICTNENDYLAMFSFREKHREYNKIKALNVGQEIVFEYSPINGDPDYKTGGAGNEEKYLRLAKVR